MEGLGSGFSGFNEQITNFSSADIARLEDLRRRAEQESEMLKKMLSNLRKNSPSESPNNGSKKRKWEDKTEKEQSEKQPNLSSASLKKPRPASDSPSVKILVSIEGEKQVKYSVSLEVLKRFSGFYKSFFDERGSDLANNEILWCEEIEELNPSAVEITLNWMTESFELEKGFSPLPQLDLSIPESCQILKDMLMLCKLYKITDLFNCILNSQFSSLDSLLEFIANLSSISEDYQNELISAWSVRFIQPETGLASLHSLAERDYSKLPESTQVLILDTLQKASKKFLSGHKFDSYKDLDTAYQIILLLDLEDNSLPLDDRLFKDIYSKLSNPQLRLDFIRYPYLMIEIARELVNDDEGDTELNSFVISTLDLLGQRDLAIIFDAELYLDTEPVDSKEVLNNLNSILDSTKYKRLASRLKRKLDERCVDFSKFSLN